MIACKILFFYYISLSKIYTGNIFLGVQCTSYDFVFSISYYKVIFWDNIFNINGKYLRIACKLDKLYVLISIKFRTMFCRVFCLINNFLFLCVFSLKFWVCICVFNLKTCLFPAFNFLNLQYTLKWFNTTLEHFKCSLNNNHNNNKNLNEFKSEQYLLSRLFCLTLHLIRHYDRWHHYT